MQILQSLKAEEKDTQSLTAIHDRGGLTYIKTSFTTLLEYVEHQFWSSNQFDTQSFVHVCINNNTITSAFYNLTEDFDEDEDVQEKHHIF